MVNGRRRPATVCTPVCVSPEHTTPTHGNGPSARNVHVACQHNHRGPLHIAMNTVHGMLRIALDHRRLLIHHQDHRSLERHDGKRFVTRIQYQSSHRYPFAWTARPRSRAETKKAPPLGTAPGRGRTSQNTTCPRAHTVLRLRKPRTTPTVAPRDQTTSEECIFVRSENCHNSASCTRITHVASTWRARVSLNAPQIKNSAGVHRHAQMPRRTT